MTYGVAAAFSADEDGTVRLPFDLAPAGSSTTSGSAGWPGTRCGWCRGYADALRGLKAIYLDGGTRDEWYLELGAHRLPRRAGRDRRHGRRVRDLRGRARRHRLPLPAGLAYLAERLTP